MAWEPGLYHVSNQAENSQGLGNHIYLHTCEAQRGPGPGQGGCSVLLQPRGHLWHWYLSPKPTEPFCTAPSVRTGPRAGETSPARIFPLPTGTDDTQGTLTPQFRWLLPRQARGLLPGERGHPSGSAGEGKQTVIFVTILHSNSKTFGSVLTSNLIWIILPVWHSQVALISPCGWGFLGGEGLFWGHSMWTLEPFPVQTKW